MMTHRGIVTLIVLCSSFIMGMEQTPQIDDGAGVGFDYKSVPSSSSSDVFGEVDQLLQQTESILPQNTLVEPETPGTLTRTLSQVRQENDTLFASLTTSDKTPSAGTTIIESHQSTVSQKSSDTVNKNEKTPLNQTPIEGAGVGFDLFQSTPIFDRLINELINESNNEYSSQLLATTSPPSDTTMIESTHNSSHQNPSNDINNKETPRNRNSFEEADVDRESQENIASQRPLKKKTPSSASPASPTVQPKPLPTPPARPTPSTNSQRDTHNGGRTFSIYYPMTLTGAGLLCYIIYKADVLPLFLKRKITALQKKFTLFDPTADIQALED